MTYYAVENLADHMAQVSSNSSSSSFHPDKLSISQINQIIN